MVLPSCVVRNKLLRDFSTLGVGGPARYFAGIQNKDQLLAAYEFARDNSLDILALGRGSNILFSDGGFPGMVLRMELRRLHFQNKEFWADAGAPVSSMVSLGTELGFTGYECFAGLPGTVGGAVYGNAGCYGKEFWDCVEAVEFFDGEFFQIQKKESGMDQFGYRRSFFKEYPNYVVVSAKLKVRPRNTKLVASDTGKVRALRQKSQPKERSIGCIFKNPVKDGKIIPAGVLIEKAGLKGCRIGNAKISEAHANFFVNAGGAKARDFLELIKIVKSGVFMENGILLAEEINRVGEF